MRTPTPSQLRFGNRPSNTVAARRQSPVYYQRKRRKRPRRPAPIRQFTLPFGDWKADKAR
jgi:hypothetical protein